MTLFVRQLCVRSPSFKLKNGGPIFTVRGNASAACAKPTAVNRPTEDEVEWKNAKPFDEIPGLRSVPLFGTFWGMLPLIGTLSSFIKPKI